MNRHPADLWAFALGDLDPARSAAIERHLGGCLACRRRVRAWRRDLEATVDALPAVPPTAEARERALAAARAALPRPPSTAGRPRSARPAASGIGRRLAPALAVAIVLATSGVAWQRHDAWRAVEAERAIVAAWLTRDDVVRLSLPREEPGSRSPGTVMVADDGVVLVVMRGAAPAGRDFQVWGQDERGATSLGTVAGTVLRADASRFREVWVTLEPSGGSAAPTRVIGRVPVGS
jgi:anti-sigma factor RsiW